MSGERELDRNPDVLVIGGGAGGLAAARASARRGARTVLVQEGRLGGDCTFTGCVPSKTIIESAARGSSFIDALAAARVAVEAIAAAEDDSVLRREGVEVVHGRASFRSREEVDVDGIVSRPKATIIATGARPAIPPIPDLAATDYLTNEDIFDLDSPPASLAVLGGGPIGCELAQAFARLGVAVTVVEALDRLLPRGDPEASSVITEVFARQGLQTRTGARVVRVEALEKKGAVRLHFDAGESIEADRLLVAVGREATTEALGSKRRGLQPSEDSSSPTTPLRRQPPACGLSAMSPGSFSSRTPPTRWEGSRLRTHWRGGNAGFDRSASRW